MNRRDGSIRGTVDGTHGDERFHAPPGQQRAQRPAAERHHSRLSVSICCDARRLAPSASRMAISRRLVSARASIRLARFAQPMSSTRRRRRRERAARDGCSEQSVRSRAYRDRVIGVRHRGILPLEARAIASMSAEARATPMPVFSLATANKPGCAPRSRLEMSRRRGRWAATRRSCVDGKRMPAGMTPTTTCGSP